MNLLNSLQSGVVADVSLFGFITSIALAIIYGLVLARCISSFSQMVGNKSQYFSIFPLLIPTTVLIISIIKSSLALSLGLVGALSIIRFRTPIKDPEELAYIFLAIAIGLGLGAGQIIITTIVVVIMLCLIFLLGKIKKSKSVNGVFLDFSKNSVPNTQDLLDSIIETFKNERIAFDIKRLDYNASRFDATFYVEPESLENLQGLLKTFSNKDKELGITLINKTRELA